MNFLMTRGLLLVSVACCAVGCGNSAEVTKDHETKSESVQVVAGHETFKAQCAKCHSLDLTSDGVEGGWSFKGPNLVKIGADPRYSRSELIAYIRNPRERNDKSRMPAFGKKLTEENLQNLVDYLLSLK